MQGLILLTFMVSAYLMACLIIAIQEKYCSKTSKLKDFKRGGLIMHKTNEKIKKYVIVYNPCTKWHYLLIDWERDILFVFWRDAYVLNGDLIIEDTKCKLYTNIVNWTNQVKYEVRQRNLGRIICETDDEKMAIKIYKNLKKKGE